MKTSTLTAMIGVLLVSAAPAALADTLWLKDGTVNNNCFVRDEGLHFTVWAQLADVGTPNYRIVPRSEVKVTEAGWFKVDKGAEYDAHPNLQDLGISHIEINPKLASLHTHIDYDKWGRPLPKGPGIPDLGEEGYQRPEALVKGLKLSYAPGEQITMIAYVRNTGFVAAKRFDYVWSIDGQELARGHCDKPLQGLEESRFEQKWNWQAGFHNVTFKIIAGTPEIATINDELTDALWGWGLTFTINRGRIGWWHNWRNGYGTFSFEDYYRWQMDVMNMLLAASKFPAAPEGSKARVRIDRIIWCDDYQEGEKLRADADGIFRAQGLWSWGDTPEEKAGKWDRVLETQHRSGEGEWSTLHELGHQLGAIDWYMFDCHPDMDPNHTWADTGEPITSFMVHPDNMMHSDGPNLFSEVDAAYWNLALDQPRGYFGDYVFAIPQENFLSVVDVNGLPVPDAKVEIYQRGVKLEPNGRAAEDQGVKYFPVVEDGDFGAPVSKEPVIVGTTDRHGLLRLPNRPAKEVRTLNGIERHANPFGNVNVVGNRALMLVKITKVERPVYYWLQIYDFNVAWFRGQRDRFTMVLKTPYRSVGSPLAPGSVTVTPVDGQHVKITWQAPPVVHEQQYLERVIGYRVYRRIGPLALNDRPWFAVATVGPDVAEVTVDLTQRPEDVYYFNATNRFAVSTLGELSMESELVEAPIATKK
jgi:hypothetical protein